MISESAYAKHTRLVKAVAAGGVEPPKAWTALNERFTAFVADKGDATERLTRAVIEGDAEAISALRPLALTEALADAQPQIAGMVNTAVRTAVLNELTNTWARHADATYKSLAAKFDTAAKKFIAAADLADPEADAETILTGSDKARTAWTEAPMIAAQLDELMPALHAAAVLCGTISAKGSDPLTLLPMTVDVINQHRRHLWTAWRSDGRAGRWSALVALGATIRAHPDPASIEPYRTPKPYETRTQTTAGETRVYQVDPEDADYEPEPGPFSYAGQGSFVG